MMHRIVHYTMHRGRGLKRRPKKQFKAQMAPDPEFVGSFLSWSMCSITFTSSSLISLKLSTTTKILKSPKRWRTLCQSPSALVSSLQDEKRVKEDHSRLRRIHTNNAEAIDLVNCTNKDWERFVLHFSEWCKDKCPNARTTNREPWEV